MQYDKSGCCRADEDEQLEIAIVRERSVLGLRNELNQLSLDVQKITALLIDLVRADRVWWEINMPMLVSQPLNGLKASLRGLNDTSLIEWNFDVSDDRIVPLLGPIEAIIWLASLCRLDRILIGALPRRFIDEFELQWQVIALHWVGY